MKNSNFQYVSYGEPHAKRRKILLQQYPAIKKLMGYDIKQAFPVFIIVPLQLFIAKYIDLNYGSTYITWWTVLLFVYFVGAILTHWLTMAVHETSHYLIFKRKWQNKCLAIFSNIPILFPFAMTFHKYHPRHHTFLGVDDIDADLPHEFEIKMIGSSRIKKFIWWLFNPFFYFVRGAINSTPTNKWELINIFFIGITSTLIFFWLGWAGIIYLLLCTYFSMGAHPVAAHFIHEHYLYDGDQETFSYYGVLNKFSYNVGYHYEHHDFMNVPGSKLPELNRLLDKEYNELSHHYSWSRIIWDFILRKDMGLSSRLVRTRKDFFKDMKGYVSRMSFRKLYK